jgi:2,3-bisphosphoglycerate-dependent phosphoglycerate mutase
MLHVRGAFFCYACDMSTLVIIRHGQSQWNLENRFTGWTDVPLTDRGKEDAHRAGKVLKEKGFKFDTAFTSLLMRAADTLDILLEELGQKDIPVKVDSSLNERHYGSLQGLNKAETAEKHGQEQVSLWRRDFFTRPPDGESMEDCERRTTPFFTHYVLPLVHSGKNVIVTASGNSMRPMIKYLDGIIPEETAKLELGLCTPYVYTFEGEKMVNKETVEVPGIVTKGASQTEGKVEEGRV